MGQFKFAAAQHGETIVYGAQRPGYASKSVDLAEVRDWISFMQKSGMRRVCCLLPPKQLAYYQDDLLGEYREAFGKSNVCQAEVEDYHLCDHTTLEGRILPFLVESDQASTPVVVHCSGGSGRTGHVLAAWLVRHRGLSVDAALAVVVASGRNPREAVQCGNATEQELRRLLAGADSERASSMDTETSGSTRLSQLASKVASLPSDTQARRGIKGVMLGALYALGRAAELGYQPRIGDSLVPGYDEELAGTGNALATSSAVPQKWLSGFYWASALWRLAVVYERSLKLLFNDYKSQRHELEQRALSGGFVSQEGIEYLRKAFQDTNEMKHADGSLLKSRRLENCQEAITAAEQLYELLRVACQRGSTVG